MKTVPAGTPTSDPLEYTSEQCLALFGVPFHIAPDPESAATHTSTAEPNMLQPLTPEMSGNAARPEFVNHVLCPDGTILTSLDDVLANAKERAVEVMSHTGTDNESVQAAVNAMVAVKEIQMHVEQARFLCVVDSQLAPRIWFQCAVPGNPDVYPVAAEG